MRTTWGRSFLAWVVGGLVALVALPGTAFERTDILDAFDKGDPFDAALALRYEWQRKTARITREFECKAGNSTCTQAGVTDARVVRFNELDFTSTWHTMWIDVRIGLYHDFELYTALPLVIAGQDQLRFGSGVDESNSTVYTGAAAVNTNLIDLPGGKFNGPTRAGFGDMILGLRGAPLAYERHPEYPDWVLGTELRMPTGTVRRGSNDGVGQGLYEWKIYTDVSRRVVDFFEVYFGLSGTLRFAGGDTLFKDYGAQLNDTQDEVEPGPTLGIAAGVNFIPWEVWNEDRRVQIELGFDLAYNFEGRAYSELFEGLSRSSCREQGACDATRYFRKAVLDGSDHTSGVTDYEPYAVYGGWLAVSVQPIRWVDIGLKVGLAHEEPHYITFANIGKDLPNPTTGVGNGVIEEPTNVPADVLPYHEQNEYNPVYVEALDLIGRRFYSEGSLIVDIMLTVAGKF